jgi:phosphoribosylformylglycinamidine synthase subunit PurL
MVGIVDDITKICGQGWQHTGDRIYLMGVPTSSGYPQGAPLQVTLGASEYLATLHQTVAGQPPSVNFDLELKVQAACRHGIHKGWIKSAHDSVEGGLAVALAECCISGKKGAAINIGSINNRLDEVLFGEGGARIIVSIDPTHQAELEAYLDSHVTDAWQYLGVVGTASDRFQITAETGLIDLDIAAITETWATAIERRLDV